MLWLHALILAVAIAVGLPSTAESLSSCVLPETVGVDTSFANNFVTAIRGKAPGQTFLATRTLIRSITVWRRAAQDSNSSPMKLWITEVDSTGLPLTDRVLLDGPVIRVPFGDGVHPIKIQYVLDPPFSLPAPGSYAFFVQHRCFGFFGLLTVRDADVYPDGEAWRTGRSSFSGCILRRLPSRLIANDLVFEIEFCGDAPTPVRSKSWGKLKVIYR